MPRLPRSLSLTSCLYPIVLGVLLAWVYPYSLRAQALPLDEYHVRVFTPADGLPVGYVNGIAQAADGSIYISTGRGLARFDGYTFHHVPLPG
jgi:ligand-binding sensor domain-containing protein